MGRDRLPTESALHIEDGQPREQLLRAGADGVERELADHALQQHVLLRGAEIQQQMILERDADIGQRAG